MTGHATYLRMIRQWHDHYGTSAWSMHMTPTLAALSATETEEAAWLAQVDADPLYGQTEAKGTKVNNAGGPEGRAGR